MAAASLFSQPPVAYFQPLESPLNTCTPSFISCETPGCQATFGGSSLTEFETISSKICGWAGELGKDHDLRQPRNDHCAWLFSEQAAPFHIGAELPSSALIPTAQRQPRVDFLSSASAMKNIFLAACDEESAVGVMVHRIGDWLVLDDGTEISACLSAAPRSVGEEGHPPSCPAQEHSAAEQLRCRAEQRHRAAAEHAEAAEARAAGAQRRLEEARAALWQAEEEAREASEALEEALAHVARAAEDLERPRSCGGGGQRAPRGCCAAAGVAWSGSASAGVAVQEQPRERPPVRSRVQSLDIPVDAPEEWQLYRNLLGHSIRRLHDETARDARAVAAASAGEPPVSGSGAANALGDLVALDGHSSAFRQVGVWKIADDASVVVGSRMLCLGNAEHPKITLYLHSGSVLSDTQLLEHWVECVIAGVPEFAICFHRDGAVQSYTLYKVCELRAVLEERTAIGRKLQMTLEVLRWIKRQCRFEGCTYWLSKAKNEPTLKLFKLSDMAAQGSSGKDDQAVVCLDASLNHELVLKNTFLHVPETDEADEGVVFRRSQSCPARFYKFAEADGLDWPQPFLSLPLRERISALFFRRAVSLSPSAEATRFLQLALDSEAPSPARSWNCRGELPLLQPLASHGRRLLLQSCCHLGLAICELSPPRPCDTGSEHHAALLLKALRTDAPRQCSGSPSSPKYNLIPLQGRVCRAQLLWLAVPRPPHERPPHVGPAAPGSLPSLLTALARSGDALALLAAATRSGSLDRQRVERVAFPTIALSLLRLASELCGPSAAGGPGTAGSAWRALLLARQFAALDALGQRPELPPLFAHLPSSEDLLVRVEHLSGIVLPMAACPGGAGGTASRSLSEEPVQRRLTKLEQWVMNHATRVADAIAVTSASVGTSPTMPSTASGTDIASGGWHAGIEGISQYQCRVQAAWHCEQSIRLLPTPLHRRGGLLHQLMLELATALVAVAASAVRELRVGATMGAAACGSCLEVLVDADLQLGRAEDLAEAAGHGAMRAVVQAGRGHVRSLAADALVSRALVSGTALTEVSFSREEELALEQLCRSGDAGEAESEPGPGSEPERAAAGDGAAVRRCFGRLGDQAMSLVLEAQRGVDAVIEPDATYALAVMSSGALQAAAARLWSFPPPGFPDSDCRRAVLAMLTQSLQVLGQGGHGTSDAEAAEIVPNLTAHAHLMQGEVHVEPHGLPGTEKPQQRHQRVAWHLERARTALHGEAQAGAAAELLLLHIHLVRAQLLAPAAAGGRSRRQAERAVEELLAACRVLRGSSRSGGGGGTGSGSGSGSGTAGSGGDGSGCGPQRGGAPPPGGLNAAWREASECLLRLLRGALRELCAREAAAVGGASRGRGLPSEGSAPGGRWKVLYRAALQLGNAADLMHMPDVYDGLDPAQGI